MPAYVRKQPLIERIKAWFDVYDVLLWLSEEIESHGWEQVEKAYAIPIGLGINLAFLIARANIGRRSKNYDDVFGETSSTGWGAAAAWFVVNILTLICGLNTFYTFFRKRHYRMFEAPVDVVPQTPSARRVKLNSSPVSSSPLRFLSTILGSDSAEARAHPDPHQDVWEVAVWDPLPVSLRLFCFFSPLHVILYWLFLPTLPSDPRPSTTVVTALILAFLTSVQMSYMTKCFSQQSKDSALISKEVLNEYDTKFVKPRTTPLYRDVATQYSEAANTTEARDDKYNNVVAFPPAFVINRGFKTNPNPNYSQQTGTSTSAQTSSARPSTSTPDFRSPLPRQDFSSPLRPQTAIRQPTFRPTGGYSDGGSLGVYSHAQSPLRKAASTNFTPMKGSRGQYLRETAENRRSISPEKRRSTPASGMVNANAASQRWGHLKPDKARRETGNF
ncbi:hypothetical protein PMZ80_008056 [Knufia obscura]|uniref:Meiotically up-regulated gene 154 protein n=1 Tax=Knufia obscura TaxID=1635080 RepID=A0ABR0RGD1_9EURO|nr:hypothetical protein PMZ80_008056 [Knufia obscura]